MPHQTFSDLRNEDVLEHVTDRHGNDRWVILVGQREEVLFEYLLDSLNNYPKGRRRLHFGTADTWFGDDGSLYPDLRLFLEEHMVSSTPAILLIRKGNQEAMITGAIPFDRLKSAIDDLCTNRPQDRIDDMIAEMEAAGPVPDLPLHRTEAGHPDCSTCDGGGCPDCTDPA
ncbi:thioredoxin domain [Gordonia phage Pleakley]|uniref:Thioredoxin n=1 Tax=Gordonia phage Pleakley TaxID=2283246 RepID=A0A345M6J0_9CAUD|nr:thioredoxin domain [Gordonia phage Pleakley]AXH49797.1 thioredoxin [Gordonia phage Fury]AXH66111.1 thioredoxin [Gordonia phage Pleakley]